MPFTGGERPVGEHSTAGSALVHHRTTQACHSEERSDVGISGRQLRFRRWLSHDPAGYCEIATSAYGLLAMTNRGASTVLTAAGTDRGVPSRDCTPRALPRASRSGRHVGLRPPRNDNSGAGAVLAAAGTGCECSAGSGMPLPYNAYTKTPNGRGLRPGHGFYTRREEGWKTCGGILLTFRASA